MVQELAALGQKAAPSSIAFVAALRYLATLLVQDALHLEIELEWSEDVLVKHLNQYEAYRY